MAITFPSSPSSGDIFTSNGRSWQYINGKWEAYGEIIAPDVFSVDEVNDVVNVYGSLAAGASASIAGDLAVDTNTLFVDSTTDRVGIGTTGPSFKLDVNGTAAFSNAVVSGEVNAGRLIVDTETLYVDSTNNRVGVGTTTPAARLTVYSDNLGGGDTDNYLMMDRPSTSYETAVNWATAGTKKWFLGLDDVGTDDVVLYDWHGSKFAMRGHSGTGILTLPSHPAFYAWKSGATQTSTSGDTILFESVTMNRGNHYSTSTSTFTAPIGGVYYFSLRVLSGNDSSDTDIRFKVNGTILNTYSGYGSTYGGHKQSILTGTIYLNANDTISGGTFGSGDTLYGNATFGHSSFSGFLLG